MLNDQYYRRSYVIAAIVIAVVTIFIIRLFFVQIIDDSAKAKADGISLLRQTVYAPRGLIYDRNGELLVYNQPIYEITMVYREMGSDFDTLAFCHALNLSPQAFVQRTTEIADKAKNPGFSRNVPQIFMTQLAVEDIAALQESQDKFPGIGIRKRTLRDYRYPYAAHVLGSIGEVNRRDIERDPYYQSGDYSGREGIERTYEKILRGEKGVEVLMRDNHGRIQGPYRNGELDVPPIAGEDITITLDIQLQQLAEQLLQGKIGSAIAIEPATGEILAMASNPTWDPKMLVGRQRSANYMELLNDRTKPLMNRAAQAQYSPGSTFKTLQALICQQEGAITPGKLYPCSGPGSTPIKCTHHHGSPVDLTNAIEQSCNPYFWYAFRDMLELDGYGKNNENFRRRYQLWCDDARSFGLGQKFDDSDVADQSAGKIPTLALYDRYYGKTGWRALTIRSNAIGQGEVLLTPLQLANIAATIANEGYYITPHLLRHDTMLTHRHETAVQQRYYPAVKRGMVRVMTNGTGRHNALPDSIRSAGKTGTVQNKAGRDHAIFIGYAPADNPKIAVAVVVENAGFGATWAAPIGTMLEEQYLLGQIKRKDKKAYIETTILNPNVKKRLYH